jgi:hypothetical protein
MAVLLLLHKSQLDDFATWLEQQGYNLRERKGQKLTNIECVSEQKSTNAELIRSMNDEELANLLSQTSKVIPDTYDSILEWLKSESDVAVSELCNFDVRR